MFTIYAIHPPDPARLDRVRAEMAILGPPSIEVVQCGDHYRALEGSHRLAAADALGMIPDLVVRQQQDDFDVSRYDWFDGANWADIVYPAGEVVLEVHSSSQAVAYHFRNC
jgi:hypothetical protein